MLIETIHDNDPMFFDNKEHYFNCGYELCEIVKRFAMKLDDSNFDNVKVLELPSGFGRVTRHLVNNFKPSNVCTIDIYDDANEFLSNILKTNSIRIDVGDYLYQDVPNNEFDIAVMGSLITHFNEEASKIILNSFMDKVTNSGFGIITTHGQKSYELLKHSSIYQVSDNARDALINDYEEGKFGFCAYDENHSFEKHTTDVAGSSYGISLIPDSWIRNFCTTHELSIIEHLVAGWDNHQDVYVIQRKS